MRDLIHMYDSDSRIIAISKSKIVNISARTIIGKLPLIFIHFYNIPLYYMLGFFLASADVCRFLNHNVK